MDLKELLEKKAKLAAEIRSLADKANDDSQEYTAEDEARWESVNADYNTTVELIEAEESRKQKLDRAAAIEQSLEDRRNIGREDRAGNATGDTGGTSEPACTDEHRLLAMQAWMRHQNGYDLEQRHEEACQLAGVNPRRSALEFGLPIQAPTEQAWCRNGTPMFERRNMTVGTLADGGYTVPEGFVADLEQALLAFSGPRQVSRVVRTNGGNDLPWPTVDDTSNTGVLLAEAGSIGSSVDPTFSQVVFKAYKYSSKPILISAELLEDSAFTMATVVNQLIGERLGRITALDYTTGSGTNKPKGVVTCAAAGVTAASNAAITADELISLSHTIDPAYRSAPGVGFMFNDSTLQAIRKLKDGNSQYLWQPGLQSGTPDQILGKPYTVNQNMASIATTAISVLFGDFQKFIIRDMANVRFYRLEERYRDNDLTGFVAFLRTDSDCIQANAIKKLTHPV